MPTDHYLLEMDKFTGSVIAAHDVPILSRDNLFEIERAGSPSGLSYEIHTGRELLMMIEGIKPLSVFSKYTWEEFDPYGGQRFEELHAQFGIQKHVYLEQDGLMGIFFCLPGEEWRITAYRNMRDDMLRNGHGSELERMEGELLGYTEEQCNEYMEQWEENWHARFDLPYRR